jgi:transcription elongation GreA/GreB family factor
VISKKEIVLQLIEKLESEVSVLESAAHAALEAATSTESKAENQYDTRSTEASYLAGAQAHRVQELKRQIHSFKQLEVKAHSNTRGIDVGDLVELDQGGRKSWVLLAAQGGGLQGQVVGQKLLVITPITPLGEALMGQKVGDEVEVEAHDGSIKEYHVCRAL